MIISSLTYQNQAHQVLEQCRTVDQLKRFKNYLKLAFIYNIQHGNYYYVNIFKRSLVLLSKEGENHETNHEPLAVFPFSECDMQLQFPSSPEQLVSKYLRI